MERIAYDEGGAVGGGGGVSAIEAEVLQLRRDLASAKIQVASHELRGTDYELRGTSYKIQVARHCELQATSHCNHL